EAQPNIRALVAAQEGLLTDVKPVGNCKAARQSLTILRAHRSAPCRALRPTEAPAIATPLRIDPRATALAGRSSHKEIREGHADRASRRRPPHRIGFPLKMKVLCQEAGTRPLRDPRPRQNHVKTWGESWLKPICRGPSRAGNGE